MKRLVDWVRSRAALVAELEEAREAVADRDKLLGRITVLEEEVTRITKQRTALRRALDEANCTLAELRDNRPFDASVRPAAGVTGMVPRAELLLEKARADALAERVQQLQEANMAKDRAGRLA